LSKNIPGFDGRRLLAPVRRFQANDFKKWWA
jgi:hypothetical protein